MEEGEVNEGSDTNMSTEPATPHTEDDAPPPYIPNLGGRSTVSGEEGKMTMARRKVMTQGTENTVTAMMSEPGKVTAERSEVGHDGVVVPIQRPEMNHNITVVDTEREEGPVVTQKIAWKEGSQLVAGKEEIRAVTKGSARRGT